jgi:V/A-type H+/Na+-transporting ATPase subunit I
MFRPAAMCRMRAVVLERDERAVLRELGRMGVLQLTRTQPGADSAPLPPHDRSKELGRCDHALARVEAMRQSLELDRPAKELNPPEMHLFEAEQRLRSLEGEADELLKRRQRLLNRWDETIVLCKRVSVYRGLDLPLDSPERFSFLHLVTGSLPAANLPALEQGIGDNVALLPLPEQQGRQPLIAMTTRHGRVALESALQQAGFQSEALPAVEGATVDTVSESIQHEQRGIVTELEEVKAKLQAFAAGCAHTLAEIDGLVAIERCLLEAEQNFPRTEAAILLSGWVPANHAAGLEGRLRQITVGKCVVETAAAPGSSGEQIPILLRQPRLLRPFEMLVSAYGLPRYQEIEPTLFVALSYVLMFGMMFGDAGHGAVLAVAGLIGLACGRTDKIRDAGLLILFAAASSIVFGFVFGGCFGLESFKKYALWHDPLEGDPIALMHGAIGIGIVIISLGLILNIINRFRRGDVIGGLLDKFGIVGLVFYWGGLALVTKYAALESRGLVNVAIILFLALPAVGWALKEPVEYVLHRQAGHAVEPGGGLFAAITESLVGAFEAVLSYLANTISFVRLAAYALSHAALLVAAFMMAEEVRHFPVGGGVLSVLVIILGNLVAIVLEGIIASVQALRLEYYEFFGKFFSGGGQAFKPFCLLANERAGKGALV